MFLPISLSQALHAAPAEHLHVSWHVCPATPSFPLPPVTSALLCLLACRPDCGGQHLQAVPRNYHAHLPTLCKHTLSFVGQGRRRASSTPDRQHASSAIEGGGGRMKWRGAVCDGEQALGHWLRPVLCLCVSVQVY